MLIYSFIKRKLVELVYNSCSDLIALSEEWKDKLSQIVPIEKITVIENYSIIDRSAMIERQNRENNKTVLFLGELGERKGCFDIPDIVKEVAEKVPDVQFILAGDGSKDDVAKIKTALEEKKLYLMFIFQGGLEIKKKLI